MKEEYQVAQGLKISLLRLARMRELKEIGSLYSEDSAFGEENLVLALAKLDTYESRSALCT